MGGEHEKHFNLHETVPTFHQTRQMLIESSRIHFRAETSMIPRDQRGRLRFSFRFNSEQWWRSGGSPGWWGAKWLLARHWPQAISSPTAAKQRLQVNNILIRIWWQRDARGSYADHSRSSSPTSVWRQRWRIQGNCFLLLSFYWLSPLWRQD